MTFLDLFAGIGGFRRGLELAGHKCIGFCEFDKFAVASYTSMHLITEEQRKKLAGIPIKQRQKEILKEEYRNGEWYAADIRNIRTSDMPKADCWCFGFPCQDISVAGKQAGFRGKRSSLFFTVTGLIRDIEKEDRPSYLLIENVKNLLSINRGFDFARLLIELDEIGYDVQWQTINSSDYVPQNRERVFLVGHFRGRSTAKVFPIKRADGEDRIFQIGNFMATKNRENPNQGRIYDPDGIAPCLNKMDGGRREPYIALPCFCDLNYGESRFTQIARCLQGRYAKGVCGRERETSGVAIPVLTPEQAKNERKCGDNVYFEQAGQDFNPAGVIGGLQEHQTIREDGISPALTSAMGMGGGQTPCIFLKQNVKPKQGNGIYLQMPGGFLVYCIWYEKYQCYIAIRKLTPKECFRLQGWADDYFDRAAFVNSDSQLYKQAGNGVTVPVIQEIGERMK